MTLIALDAMGGDFAPRAPVGAALRADREGGCELMLVGEQEALAAELRRDGRSPRHLRVVHAGQQLHMDDPPTALLREKPQASIRVAVEQVAAGRAQAVVSAGHSGAMMVSGKHALGTLEGIDRPAIATPLPLKRGTSLLLDSGANVDCKPHYLLQFARMGRLYARVMLEVERPRVALLSNGAEAGKGNELVRAAYPLLERSIDNFVGNVEARDLFRGKADVIVCDGFVGNLVLKTAEAAAFQLRLLLKDSVARSPVARLGSWLLRSFFAEVARRSDWREVGGSLLLGLRGVAVVAHGGSSAYTLYNAIRLAQQCVEHRLVEALAAEFARDAGAQAASPGPGPAAGSGH